MRYIGLDVGTSGCKATVTDNITNRDKSALGIELGWLSSPFSP